MEYFNEYEGRLFMECMSLADSAPSGREIIKETLNIMKMLLEKNVSYGDSALNPINVFSKVNTEDQIDIRLDDKLSRIKRGSEYKNEDTINDIIGYLILKKICRNMPRV